MYYYEISKNRGCKCTHCTHANDVPAYGQTCVKFEIVTCRFVIKTQISLFQDKKNTNDTCRYRIFDLPLLLTALPTAHCKRLSLTISGISRFFVRSNPGQKQHWKSWDRMTTTVVIDIPINFKGLWFNNHKRSMRIQPLWFVRNGKFWILWTIIFCKRHLAMQSGIEGA